MIFNNAVKHLVKFIKNKLVSYKSVVFFFFFFFLPLKSYI
jgi:hypothetical protein